MPRGAQMGSTLNEPKEDAPHSNIRHYLWACSTSGKEVLILDAKQPMKIVGNQLPMESLIELKESLITNNANIRTQIHRPTTGPQLIHNDNKTNDYEVYRQK
jgi:hypothetical protein